MNSRRYIATKHPDVEGGWTVEPYVGEPLLFASERGAEVSAAGMNAAREREERSKILGDVQMHDD